MFNKFYVLDGHLEVVEPDFLKWAQFFDDAKKRIVKQEWVGNVWVSTVFLGLNHNWGRKDPRPLLYETMLFTNRADLSETMSRWHTWAEAEAGHAAIIKELETRLKEKKL